MSCSTVRLRSLKFVRRKTTVLDEWLLVSTLSYPMVGPRPRTSRDGDEPYSTTNWICLVVFGGRTITWKCRKTGDNLTPDDCSLAPLPLVCGGQATTFGFRQMEDGSSWRLISRFCCLSLKMEVKDKSLLLFTKWFMTLLSLQKFSLGPTQQCHKSLSYQWCWIIIEQ